jgi:hypothetical protein
MWRSLRFHLKLTGAIKTFIEEKKKVAPAQQGNFLIVTPNGKKLDAGTVYHCVNKCLNRLPR